MCSGAVPRCWSFYQVSAIVKYSKRINVYKYNTPMLMYNLEGFLVDSVSIKYNIPEAFNLIVTSR